MKKLDLKKNNDNDENKDMNKMQNINHYGLIFKLKINKLLVQNLIINIGQLENNKNGRKKCMIYLINIIIIFYNEFKFFDISNNEY